MQTEKKNGSTSTAENVEVKAKLATTARQYPPSGQFSIRRHTQRDKQPYAHHREHLLNGSIIEKDQKRLQHY